MKAFFRRARRKIGRLLRQFIPYNSRYRPLGIHPGSQQLASRPGSGATYVEIVPGYLSEVPVPALFYEQAASYGVGVHAKPRTQEPMPPAFVLALPQGRLYADNPDSVAVIARDGWLVGDVSFQYANKAADLTSPADNNIFRQRYFVRPVPVAGTVCSLLSGGGAAMGNYYHWLIDSLPRLHMLREAGLLGEVDKFLVYDRHIGFVQRTLAPLGIRPEQLIDVTTHRHLQADRLLVTSPVRGSGNHAPFWIADFVRSLYLPPDPAAVARHQFSPYVYISRRDAAMRHVLNETAVEAVLAEFGFKTYVMSDYTITEKAALFAGARVVVSPVGAGLANILLCPPGAALLELIPKGFVVPDFLDLAHRAGMRYDWMVCANPDAAGTVEAARHQNLLVDTADLRVRVQALLKPAPAENIGV